MGNCASVHRRRIGPAEYNQQNASDEVLICEKCKCDSEKVFACKQCKQTLCTACCTHAGVNHPIGLLDNTKGTSQHTKENAENRFYHSNLHATETHTLPTNSKKATQKKVRCATIAQKGKLAFLSMLYYQDKGNTTYKWKLCYQRDKPLHVTRRHHIVDESHIFPGDICFVECKKKLYLTLPCKRKVYKLPVGEKFHEAFDTPLGSCFGIAEFIDGLALSVQIPTHFKISKWQVQFVDFRGNVLRRIQNDSRGGCMFDEPLFLTSNKEKNILFVSDHGKESVMAFDTSGQMMFEYSGIALTKPLGIAVDMYNNVYVACGKRILQIQTGGVKSKELLRVNGKDKIVSVCMDHDKDTLIVVSEWGNVSSFEFEYTEGKT